MKSDPAIPTSTERGRPERPDETPARPAVAPAATVSAGPQDHAPDTGDEPIRTLLWTAATYRPLEEVAALVSLLRRTGAVPSPGDEALRAAAVARSLDEVRQLVTLLNEPPHEVDEADTTLRAAAVGRPIEDVAQLVSILGADEGDAPPRTRTEVPREKEMRAVAGGGAFVAARSVSPGSPALRSGLRLPAAVFLVVCGLLHVPADFALVRSPGYAQALCLAATVLCVVLGTWLAVRDSPGVWAAGGATAVGVIALHAVAGIRSHDLMEGSLGASFGGAHTAAITCAALAAALAAAALLRRQKETGVKAAGAEAADGR